MTTPRSRDSVLALLLRGELLARSDLAYPRLLARLHEALRDTLPDYTRRDPEDPGDSLLAAFAAALDSFGFYHDRFLGESKLAAAQRLQSVARLAAAVGFRPRPPIAATALQHFVARSVGVVTAGTAVAGTAASGSVYYETRRPLTIGPAFNHMRLAPVIAAHAAARHAVIAAVSPTQDPGLGPVDDFAVGDLVLVSGPQGAELVPTAAARRRAIALARDLRRSYAPAAWDGATPQPTFDLGLEAALTPTTQRRRLRGWTIYDHDEHDTSYAVAELSRDPILHLRDDAAPGGLRSSLELTIVDDPRGELGDPDLWPATARWTEVAEFTDSEADDLHFRTFVDDRMRVYVQLRVRLGHRLLLGTRKLAGQLHCDRLDHVYARFTPALGNVPRDKQDEVITYPLDVPYFASPIVTRKAAPYTQQDSADHTWAMLEQALDVPQQTQILVIDDATAALYIRTLATSAGPRIAWTPPKLLPDLPVLGHRPLWQLLSSWNAALPPAKLTPAGHGRRFDTNIRHTLSDTEKVAAERLRTLAGSWFGANSEYTVEAGRGTTEGLSADWPEPCDIADADLGVPPPLQEGLIPTLTVKKARVALLDNVITPGSIRFLLDFYRHTTIPAWRYRLSRVTPPQPLENQVVLETLLIPRGELYVLLESTGSLKPGDYFLLGKRFRQQYHPPLRIKPEVPDDHENENENEDEDEDEDDIVEPQTGVLDPGWLVAEVLQAVEVHGKVVRLKYPVQNDYTVDLVFAPGALDAPKPEIDDVQFTVDPIDCLTELIAIPNVASVYYADNFLQKVQLSPTQNFVKIPLKLLASFTKFTLDPPINNIEGEPSLAEVMGWDKLKDLPTAFAGLFVGLQSLTIPLADVVATLKVTPIRAAVLPPLVKLHQVPPDAKFVDVSGASQNSSTLELTPASFADLIGISVAVNKTDLFAEPKEPATWNTPSPAEPVVPGQFRVVDTGWPRLKLPNPQPFATIERVFFTDAEAEVDWFSAHPAADVSDALDLARVPKASVPAPWTISASPKLLDIPKALRFALDEQLDGWDLQPIDDAALLIRYGSDDYTEIGKYTTPGADAVAFRSAKAFVAGALPRPKAAHLVNPAIIDFDNKVAAVWEFPINGADNLTIDGFVTPVIVIATDERAYTQEKFVRINGDKFLRTTATATNRLSDLSSAKAAVVHEKGNPISAEISGQIIAVDKTVTGTTHVVLHHKNGTLSIVRLAKVKKIDESYELTNPLANSEEYTSIHPGKGIGDIGELVGKSRWTKTPSQIASGDFLIYNSSKLTISNIKPDGANNYLVDRPPCAIDKDFVGVARGAGLLATWDALKASGKVAGIHVTDSPALIDLFGDSPWPFILFDSDKKLRAVALDIATLKTSLIVVQQPIPVADLTDALRIGPAQRWPTGTLTVGNTSAVVELAKAAVAGTPTLIAGDLLTFPDLDETAGHALATDPTELAAAWRVTLQGALAFGPDPILSVIQHRLAVKVEVSSYDANLNFQRPGTPLTPYIVIITDEPQPPLKTALLGHSARTPIEPDRSALAFTTAGALMSLGAHIKAGVPKLGFLPNSRDELFKEMYTIASQQNDAFNFLSRTKIVSDLFTRQKSPFDLKEPRPFILGKLVDGELTDHMIGKLYEGLAVDGVPSKQALRAYSQSVVFNTGNFIPVRLANVAADREIVENSLRLTVHFGPESEARLVYDEKLASHLRVMIGDGTEEEEKAGTLGKLPLNIYSYNKTNEGVFTLNILCVNNTGQSPTSVDIRVVYSTPRDPAVQDLLDKKLSDEDLKTATQAWDYNPLYLHETRVRPWNPLTQLILLDPERLKVGDYLFLRRGVIDDKHDARATGTATQWTRVQQVDGRLVCVWPPLLYQPRQIDRYVLGTYRDPVKFTRLDAAYYRLIHEEGADGILPLGKSLILPQGHAALQELIPGDRLLVWDSKAREAWRGRRGSADPDPTSPPWLHWPDAQHEVVIKAINAATGLITLKDPLPERFAVHFGDPVPDSDRYRIYPHIREAFQGQRRRQALGDGDRAARYQHFDAGVESSPPEQPPEPFDRQPPALGHYSVHAERPGSFVSNNEVLSFDPRSGEWARWTEFEDLAGAQRKDLAVSIGAERRPAAKGAQRLELELRFGDGVHGQSLPTGQRNVFLRSIDTGDLPGMLGFAAWRSLLPPREATLECLPLISGIDRDLLPRRGRRILVEHGGHQHWQPREAQRDRWIPALWVAVRRGDELVVLPELSDAEALAGREGHIVRPCDPPAPGACWVYLCSLVDDPDPANILLAERPQSEPWRLDLGFYRELLTIDLSEAPGATQVPLDETDGLREGALIAYYAGADDPAPELATIRELDPDTYSATLTHGLRRSYDLTGAHLLGNLVEVDQGKRDTYVIGSGDSGIGSLALSLFNRAPIMHRLAGTADPEPWLDVLVDGEPWRPVAAFDDSGPHDRVYRLDLEPDGHATVVFGDGQRGQIPSTGRDNIEVRLHLGDGAVGNLPAGAINVLRDGNLAVQATRNIAAAAGGRPAEDAAEARASLLARGPLDARAVTAADLVHVARSIGDILHAARDPYAIDHRHRLVVALTDRRRLDEAALTELRRRLLDQLPAGCGCDVELVPAGQVPVHLVVEVEIAAGYLEGEVLAAIDRAFAADGDGFFAAPRWPIGAALRLGDVYEQLLALPGVHTTTVQWMSQRLAPAGLRGAAEEHIDPGPTGQIACAPGLRSSADPTRGSFLVRVTGGKR